MAYSVLLVDDNQMTIESLRETVEWKELNLEVIGCCSNGWQGGKMIEQYRPDIIITDIHMPETDGLSMVEKMQEYLENTRIIFITGFDKFQYASRAIKLSAFDFILKPIDNRELYESLERAVSSLDKEKDSKREKEKIHAVIHRAQLLAMLTGGVKKYVADNEFWKLFRTKPEEYFILAAENEMGLSGPLLRRLDFITFPAEAEIISTVVDGELILFCGRKHTETSWQVTARMIADTLLQNFLNMVIAISGVHQEPEELYAAYQESRKTLLWHNIYGRHTSVEYYSEQNQDNKKHSRIFDIEQMCSKMAQKADTMEVEEIWNTIYEKSKGRLRIIRLMLMFFCSKVIQDKMTSFQRADTLDMIVYDITKLDSVEDARNWLFLFEKELDKIYAPASSTIVRNVLDYIRNHVTEGLALENVAAKYFVSPNYLSSLIRKETGLTYRQHIINAKLSVAKHMLDDTRMRVEDIAYAIGYENYISFYNVFKKTEGMSPTEYRYRNRSE